ncbi:hypothetical protein QE429_004226 [Bacillus sp. SORGH_AS 510]|uniref:hypothetical protein n=1 Tax=Bacillus sp. SORGH_AS_0510 TaxID=3041771 RepID=UPI0027891124|nr:hypothetical protein [Bacillus sp. SORGH_AS_0510]MDQ1147399.1 hypothetical protein [Bacillus sp. SORGH_AS_0510]
MESIIIDYTIPMQSAERVNEINQSFGTEFNDTSRHIENLIEQLMPSRLDLLFDLVFEQTRLLL